MLTFSKVAFAQQKIYDLSSTLQQQRQSQSSAFAGNNTAWSQQKQGENTELSAKVEKLKVDLEFKQEEISRLTAALSFAHSNSNVNHSPNGNASSPSGRHSTAAASGISANHKGPVLSKDALKFPKASEVSTSFFKKRKSVGGGGVGVTWDSSNGSFPTTEPERKPKNDKCFML